MECILAPQPNVVYRKLQTVALEHNIQHQPYPEFYRRIKKTMTEFPIIDH